MKYVDEYKDAELVKGVIGKIQKLCNDYRSDIVLMEVCGTHTMAIFRSGLKQLLPHNLKLLSGPGCPVCVTPNDYLDKVIEIAKEEKVIITTFGDMLRVPGSRSSLEKERAKGSRIEVVYSPLDSLKYAKDYPDHKIVFLGVGFETTIPTVAATIKIAAEQEISNFYVLCGHKIIPPAMQALLDSHELKLNGFILPGHVSAIIGSKAYDFIANKYNIPSVVTGFEPLDIVQGILMLVEQIVVRRRALVEIQYSRCVQKEGNPKAQGVIGEVFAGADSVWRGVGEIPQSGLKIRDSYCSFDIEKNISVTVPPVKQNKKCICGAVLRGVKVPSDCKLFRKVCTPEDPQGACMVSSEGTCAAHYKYA